MKALMLVTVLVSFVPLADLIARDNVSEVVKYKIDADSLEKIINSTDLFSYREMGFNSYAIVLNKQKTLVAHLYIIKNELIFSTSINSSNITLNRINSWNKKYKYTRAYLEEADHGIDAVLQSEIDFNSGVTSKQLTKFLAGYFNALALFKDYIK